MHDFMNAKFKNGDAMYTAAETKYHVLSDFNQNWNLRQILVKFSDSLVL
jgi:hypothetical protein